MIESFKELKGILVILCIMAVVFTALPQFVVMSDDIEQKPEIEYKDSIKRDLRKIDTSLF